MCVIVLVILLFIAIWQHTPGLSQALQDRFGLEVSIRFDLASREG